VAGYFFYPTKIIGKGRTYKNIYINGHEPLAECRCGLENYFVQYNDVRQHFFFDRNTPLDVYFPIKKTLFVFLTKKEK